MIDTGRLLTAMVTPFDDQGNVDYAQAVRLAIALLDSGSDGVVVGATTGEGPTLSREEKTTLWAEIKSAVSDRGSVVANTGNYCTWESIELTKEAEIIGVDGVLLTTPYYNKPPQEGLYQHFKAVANSTNLPCILYNIPSRSAVKIDVETVLKLSHIDNIVGIKEATGDMDHVDRILQSCAADFRIWSGNDGDTFPIMKLGGYGVICVISNLFGKQIKTLIDLVVGGHFEEALAKHVYLLPAGNGFTGIASNPIPIKYAMNRAGFHVGAPRLPLIAASADIAAMIDDLLEKYVVDLPV